MRPGAATLLWQWLFLAGEAEKGRPLPPVFLIVLYNGDAPRDSPNDLAEIIQRVNPELGGHQPCCKYWALDEKRVPPGFLAAARGPAAYVHCFSQSKARSAGIINHTLCG